MSTKSKTGSKPAPSSAPRVAKIEFAEEFKASFELCAIRSPVSKDKLAMFLQFKTERPPRLLTAGMRDHTLSGTLAGFRECHLDHDSCLIYLDVANVVHLLTIASHDEMEGGKARGLLSRIGKYRP